MTGGDGRSISDWVRFRWLEMGGSVLFSSKEDCFDVHGDSARVKLSRGFVSGGDIKLDTGGRRFMMLYMRIHRQQCGMYYVFGCWCAKGRGGLLWVLLVLSCWWTAIGELG